MSALMKVRPAALTRAEQFMAARAQTVALIEGLEAEDCALQSMPNASPLKWHLAHTSWFFEQFVLSADPRETPRRAGWSFLFNSYYQSVGPMHARAQRGLLSRPTLSEVLAYRREIDEAVAAAIDRDSSGALDALITLGLQHEQQHQELMLMDLLHLFSCNPLRPVYRPPHRLPRGVAPPLHYLDGRSGSVDIGAGDSGFAFDNERPRHASLLRPHRLANRLISNDEYRAFINDGGYQDAQLWLSDGWAMASTQQWQRPLYWDEDLQSQFTLHGRVDIVGHAPVCHISFYEADAFARWAGARLPTEAEWESAAARLNPQDGHFADRRCYQPLPAQGEGLQQMFGDCWEWTASAYSPYPGFRPLDGSLGEYNGKFMCGQQVLRGGACVTPAGHLRASYRNFFHPGERWLFSGIRLAKDA